MGIVMKLLAQALVKQLLVQILVVVANVQMRALNAEVDVFHVDSSWTWASRS